MQAPTARTEPPHHLVVRAPNWVGDVVMATPVLEAAAREVGAASGLERLSVAIRSHLAPVLHDGPLADHLLPFHGRDGEARALADCGADAALLFTNSLGAAWRAFRSGIPVRVGTALGGRGPLLSHRIAPPRSDGRRVPAPTVHVYADLAGQLGIVPSNLDLVLHHRPELDEELRQRLEGHGLARDEGYVLCVPGAAFGAAKLWPPTHHAAALDALHDRTGLRGLVTGGPGEEPTIRAVVEACRHPVIDFTEEPRDLERLKPLISQASLVLCSDSGPRWYAAAYRRPRVALVGPTFVELVTTTEEERILRLGLECSPCLERVCPLGHHRCMVELGPERAVAAGLALLGVAP